MADIELVIKIPTRIYNAIVKKNALGCDTSDIKNIIRNGTPLPKGHGRLFDERDIVNGNYDIIGNKIYEVEPIIEADKESEDK